MSKSTGVVLFQRGEESESENSDVWDDDLLTKAYDKAIKVTQDEIAKRIAMSTNNIPKPTTNPATSIQNGHAGKSKSKSNSKKKQKSIPSEHWWAPGSPCRAIYHSDGLEYEADVVHVLDEDYYLIRFIGYDNEQKVQASELKASLGDQQRYDQIKEAAVSSLQEHTTDMDCDNDVPASALGNMKRNGLQTKSKNKKSICGQSGSGYDPLKLFGHMPGADVPGGIPFPVFPGSVLEGAPAMPPLPFASDTQHELQALNAMLVSWYMSGYYTGMYHGIKKAEKKSSQ